MRMAALSLITNAATTKATSTISLFIVIIFKQIALRAALLDTDHTQTISQEVLLNMSSLRSDLRSKEAMILEELMENTWDYMTELVFTLVLAVLSLPANAFLFGFFARKVRHYKKLKHFNVRYASIANSFHTYLIEICSFDTLNIVYLILDSTFHLLYRFKKSQYESIFDISNFACKFFIYILHISAAMSNYLVFLLSLNRCFLLILCHDNEDEINSHRLCLNTKYLTLFMFCLCTIANVFRLELLQLNLHSSSPSVTPSPFSMSLTHPVNLSSLNAVHHQIIQLLMLDNNSGGSGVDTAGRHDVDQQQKAQKIIERLAAFEAAAAASNKGKDECGPNIGHISFSLGDSTHSKLFWSIIVYNLIFAVLPACGNLAASIYLIRKRRFYKRRIDLLTDGVERLRINARSYLNHVKSIPINTTFVKGEYENNVSHPPSHAVLDEDLYQTIKRQQLTEYEVEFVKTCSPCIAFSLSHVLLFLPYLCINMINQFRPRISLIQALQYMNYPRYLFYSCKFYLLILVSYRFRRETFEFITNLLQRRATTTTATLSSATIRNRIYNRFIVESICKHRQMQLQQEQQHTRNTYKEQQHEQLQEQEQGIFEEHEVYDDGNNNILNITTL